MKAIILAAVTLFGGVAFAEQAEAGSVFPEGTYEKNNDVRMVVTSDGDYKMTLIDEGYAYGSSTQVNRGDAYTRMKGLAIFVPPSKED